MAKKEDVVNAIALSKAPNIGPKLYKKIIDKLGNATQVLKLSSEQLKNKIGCSLKVIKNILSSRNLTIEAEKIYEKNVKHGIDIIPYGDSKYPWRLKDICEPPKILYTKSNVSLNPLRSIGVVGTRNASTYGISWVKEFVKNLADYNVVVVSGLAYGIDFHAHKTALGHDLPTLAIMAGGLDDIYPTDHSFMAKKITLKGGLISENSVGIVAERYNFPLRNRIIVGLSDAIVIVEAGKKSGALITARYANEVNKDVFALPGNVQNISSIGCNDLIRSHQAHLITSTDDVARMMSWKSMGSKKKASKIACLDEFPIKEKKIIATLNNHRMGTDLDALTQKTGMDPLSVSELTLKLVRKKVLEALPGNKYRLLMG